MQEYLNGCHKITQVTSTIGDWRLETSGEKHVLIWKFYDKIDKCFTFFNFFTTKGSCFRIILKDFSMCRNR